MQSTDRKQTGTAICQYCVTRYKSCRYYGCHVAAFCTLSPSYTWL